MAETNRPTRTTTLARATVLALACLLAQPLQMLGLGQGRSKTPATPANEATVIRLRAIALLDELLSDMRSVEHKESRIVMKAQIADALWDHEQAKARRYLIEAVDEMVTLVKSREPEEASALEGPGVSRSQAITSVLGLVSRRDPKLARQLADAVAPAKSSSSSDSGSPSPDALERSRQYGQFAYGLLDTSVSLSIELAKESFAEVIDSVLIGYLVKLRTKDQAAADELFARALATVRENSASWASAIDYLAMYALSGYGAPAIRQNLGLEASSIGDTQSGARLLRTVCDVAGRQLRAVEARPPDTNDVPSLPDAGRTTSVLLRLLPYFERQMPECSATIRMRADALTKALPARLQEQVVKLTMSASPEDLLSQASGVKTKEEQDRYYLLALLQVTEKGEWERALQIAEMFSTENVRSAWRSRIGYKAALGSLERKDTVAVLTYARLITTAEDAAQIFARLVKLVIDNGQMAGAMEVIRHARDVVRRGESEASRPDALLLLARAASNLDVAIAFEIAAEAIDLRNRFRQAASTKVLMARDASGRNNAKRLEETMSELARVNFDESLRIARLLEDSRSSIQCRIEICRSVLTGRP
ncbi:MAG: hypothetical protein ABI882_19370 [Acidobacteriota bacterium]